MTKNRTFIGWLLVAIIGLAPASSAYADPIVFSVAQHNIQAVNWGALRYVAEHDRPLGLTANEVCLVQALQLTAAIEGYGYKGHYVSVTNNGSNACNGQQMFNISFTLAAEVCGTQPCGYVASYPASLQDSTTPNELRGWACIRGTFLKSWVICATHLSVAQAKANAQAQYFRTSVLGPENNLRTKIGGGDFNLRPRPYGSGTYGLSHMYEQYREADQYYYDMMVNNSTRNPPASYPEPED